MNNQIQLLSRTIYNDTAEKIWANWRNRNDRFLVEYAHEKDGREMKDRKTTDDLMRFTEYLMFEGVNWKWMNVYFRWYDKQMNLLFIGQVSSYSKRYRPKQAAPTKGEVNNTLRKLSWKDGVVQAVAAYKELVLNQNQNIY
ncbi:MAG: hypothetical protein AAF960_23420 [Bacteroidota bacterium]